MLNLVHQLKEKFPELADNDIQEDKFSLYKTLIHFGRYCARHLYEDDGQIILEIVNKAYNQKQLLLCNAIESEFMYSMVAQLGPDHLKDNIKVIPDNLKLTYIKVLLETLNTTKQ